MKNKNILRLFLTFVCLTALFLSFSINTSADMGPKASVRVTFENMGEELCYGTLISLEESTGPNSVWDGDEDHIYNYDLDIEIWRAFAEYEDTDGYHFLQTAWKVSETGEIAWTYYPPNKFKILLYYPETDTFAVSGVCERYAFDTYYTVDMSGKSIGGVDYDEEKSGNERIDAYRSYNFWSEVGSFAARVFVTVAIEMAVAAFFGFTESKQFLLLAAVNAVTQIILNLLLNFAVYTSELSIQVIYVIAELAVVAIEAAVCCKYMDRISKRARTKRVYIIYSLVANAVSFGMGFVLYEYIPQMF